MARRSNSSYSGPTRYHYPIAKPRLFGPIYLTGLRSPLGDRRSFYPDVFRPADYRGLRLNRSLVVKPSRVSSSRSVLLKPDVLSFRNPRMVMICARRKMRREVLAAKGRIGRGSGHGAKRRNEFSEVKC